MYLPNVLHKQPVVVFAIRIVPHTVSSSNPLCIKARKTVAVRPAEYTDRTYPVHPVYVTGTQ